MDTRHSQPELRSELEAHPQDTFWGGLSSSERRRVLSAQGIEETERSEWSIQCSQSVQSETRGSPCKLADLAGSVQVGSVGPADWDYGGRVGSRC